MSEFKKKHSLSQLKNEALRIISKYPDRIPTIVENSKSSDLPPLDRNKFLVPKDLTIGQFVYIIRKRIKLTSEQAIFVFVNNTLPPTARLMSELYEEYKDETGFLFMTISSESVFGM